MVCYIVPLSALAASLLGRKAAGRTGRHGFWLNLMLAGGSVFGLIDHAVNGELFMAGPGTAADLALGGAITSGIFASWGLVVYRDKILSRKILAIKSSALNEAGKHAGHPSGGGL
jgi:hypothetical protein